MSQVVLTPEVNYNKYLAYTILSLFKMFITEFRLSEISNVYEHNIVSNQFGTKIIGETVWCTSTMLCIGIISLLGFQFINNRSNALQIIAQKLNKILYENYFS